MARFPKRRVGEKVTIVNDCVSPKQYYKSEILQVVVIDGETCAVLRGMHGRIANVTAIKENHRQELTVLMKKCLTYCGCCKEDNYTYKDQYR